MTSLLYALQVTILQYCTFKPYFENFFTEIYINDIFLIVFPPYAGTKLSSNARNTYQCEKHKKGMGQFLYLSIFQVYCVLMSDAEHSTPVLTDVL